MKFFNILISLFLCALSFSLMAKPSVSSKSANLSAKEVSYDFRPLLIQGRRQSLKKSRDLKESGKSIIGSRIFYKDVDLRKRVFEWELASE